MELFPGINEIVNTKGVAQCWTRETNKFNFYHFIFVTFFFFFFGHFRAASEVYGVSQARGLIGAVATSIQQSHSNAESKPRL